MDIHSATAMSVLKRCKNNLPAGLMVWKMLLNLLFTIKFMLQNGNQMRFFHHCSLPTPVAGVGKHYDYLLLQLSCRLSADNAYEAVCDV
jgi:hypothetical protein